MANGIFIYKSNFNKIMNNIIGLNHLCNKMLSNGSNGIMVKSGKNNIIGGKVFIDYEDNANDPTGDKGTITPVFVRPLLGNIISGNMKNGIKFCHSYDDEVKGNFIGTDNTGNVAFPNQQCGILIYKSSNQKILGCNIDTEPFIYYNVISGNLYAGIFVYKSKYTLIQGNFVGINAFNSEPLGNYIGIIDDDSIGTVVGGTLPLGNVVAGNITNGIYITNGSKDFTSINTFCGNAAFGPIVANGANGILIDKNSSNLKFNTNIISGNNENGIEITDDASNILITSNIIGLNATGLTMPNKGSGVVIGGNASKVSFNENVFSIIPRNIISSNDGYGLVLKNNSNNNFISNSYIGLSLVPLGLEGLTNKMGGILITDKSNNNILGNSVEIEKYLYVYDKDNFAIKLTSETFNNNVFYNFINVNILNNPLPHEKNILNLTPKNIVYNNNIPYE